MRAVLEALAIKQFRPLIGSIGVIAWWLACSPAWTQELGHAGAGLALARQACAECHAVEISQAVSPDPAAPRFETIAKVPGMTRTALSAALQSPHPTMPNVMLDADDLSNIVAYILSLRRAN